MFTIKKSSNNIISITEIPSALVELGEPAVAAMDPPFKAPMLFMLAIVVVGMVDMVDTGVMEDTEDMVDMEGMVVMVDMEAMVVMADMVAIGAIIHQDITVRFPMRNNILRGKSVGREILAMLHL